MSLVTDVNCVVQIISIIILIVTFFNVDFLIERPVVNGGITTTIIPV